MKKGLPRWAQNGAKKQQSGAALLLFILLIIVSSSALIITRLNQATTEYYRDDITTKALLKAKEALIGYALSYASSSNKMIGPGYLPCPDTSDPLGSYTPPRGPGFVEGSCNDLKLIGRFPWRTLGLPDVRDSSGGKLWYQLSKDFRNNPRVINPPFNSETVTTHPLSINGENDVVAIIFAPMDALQQQDRQGANLIDPSHYLEDVDNDFTDLDFTSPPASNDIYLTLTKGELIRALEQRVLVEVAEVLEDYRKAYGAYPWLSPFADPRLPDSYNGVAGTQQGLLPLHLEDEEFMTPFFITWDFTGLTINPQDTITAADLTSGSQLITNGICRWRGTAAIQCRGRVVIGTKSYDFDLGFSDEQDFSGETTIQLPSNTRLRTLDLEIDLSKVPSSATSPLLSIHDTASGDHGSVFLCSPPSASCNPSSASLTINGINFDLNTTPGQVEIPEWFTKNNWHQLIYLAYASDVVAGATTPCVAGGSCLSLEGTSINNIQALAILAGAALAGQDRHTANTLTDYFEAENSLPDNNFEQAPFPADWTNFNDQIKIIAPR